MRTLKIGLIGDYDESIPAHKCIPGALALSKQTPVEIETTWLDTKNLSGVRTEFDALWCVPGSPYKNRKAVLELIHYARKSNTPYLGTCGGYQHAIIEFAHNELNLKNADLEEECPGTEFPLISALTCRLNDESRPIRVLEGSQLAKWIGHTQLLEKYRCGYGMNPAYIHLFDKSDLKFVAFNDDGVPQAFELRSHPFFVGTAFQPERCALANQGHPLISSFIKAALIE